MWLETLSAADSFNTSSRQPIHSKTHPLKILKFLCPPPLYPVFLRDILMRLALHQLVLARWTDAIHDEWIE